MLRALLTGLAGSGVWLALVAPDRPDRLTPLAFARVPVEAVALTGLAVLLRGRARRLVAVLVGAALALLVVVKALDLGFGTALDRPFHPVADWSYFDSAAGLLADSVGHRQAVLILFALAGLAIAVLVGLPLAVLRLARLADRHRVGTLRAGVVLGLVWLNCAALGVQVVAGTPVAATDAARLVWDRAGQAGTDLRDERAFARAARQDPLRATPADQLLTGLRGKDVLIAFVESYGRVAVQDSSFSPGVDAVLDAGTARLRAAGFCSASAFLTSPTFGGISWLAHSTLQSGLWVDNQLRYDRLMASSRATLSVAFGRAGWRTVSDIPANEKAWPEGTTFYHYDQRYDSTNTGYAGPKFGYATMPDQYTLAALQRRELAPAHRRPVMAEIDLVSSHTPWTPLPRLVDWNAVGDGSVFDPMPGQDLSTAQVWPDPGRVRAAYGRSVEYSLSTLVSFVQHYGNDNLVLLVLGDHQPATVVSGTDAGHDVPISIIARDPAVLDRISAWGWQNGLRPGPDA
ncbi:MAG: sulfatase, partial [Actinobacteria bacterium]|nr:sulfatase [Actinomycetota bacterium]